MSIVTKEIIQKELINQLIKGVEIEKDVLIEKIDNLYKNVTGQSVPSARSC